jgi:hypothetical protein
VTLSNRTGAGATICTSLVVVVCRIHKAGTVPVFFPWTTYCPSGEIAARNALPVLVSRVNLSASNTPEEAAGGAPLHFHTPKASALRRTTPNAARSRFVQLVCLAGATGTPEAEIVTPPSISCWSSSSSLRRSVAV